ncbi:MAG: DUF1080 domain-containing protein [Verrucomicrobiales bacterium]
MNHSNFLVSILLVVAATSSHAEEAALFNGKDLTGWEGNAQVWRVEKGTILGGSLEGNPQNEFLAFKERVDHFILKFEYKLTGTEGFINGGVQFRSERVKEPANEMRGYQADIGAGFSGALYDESRRNKMLAQPTPELLDMTEKKDDWNTYEVRAEGSRIQLFLNGVKTVDYIETEEDIEEDGLIALQIHGNCKAVIAFRNLTLTKLQDEKKKD